MDSEKLIDEIFSQQKKSDDFKAALGERGLFEQSEINEKFYSGEQWDGEKSSRKRPLITANIIKRIGDYKLAVTQSGDNNIRFTANGISDCDGGEKIYDYTADGEKSAENIGESLRVLAAHFESVKKSSKLQTALQEALKKAYICGTGAVYTYWDSSENTGLYADANGISIEGEVKAVCIDIENIGFAEPYETDIDKQPYIIIKSRMSVEQAVKTAAANGLTKDETDRIKADGYCEYDGGYGVGLTDKVTVLTRLKRIRSDDGRYHIFAEQVCRGCVIRPLWDMKIGRYPICIFRWNTRNGCIYGDSEVTYLIPNQIAVNRMLTAEAQTTVMNGMPIMLVNGDLVKTKISNSPGQIITFSGDCEDFQNSVKYISPPDCADKIYSAAEALIDCTLETAGASKAALGIYEMNNAAAIDSLQKASAAPLKDNISRYAEFICAAAEIFADFFICFYGRRPVLIKCADKRKYVRFESGDYDGLLVHAEISEPGLQNIDGEANDGVVNAE